MSTYWWDITNPFYYAPDSYTDKETNKVVLNPMRPITNNKFGDVNTISGNIADTSKNIMIVVAIVGAIYLYKQVK